VARRELAIAVGLVALGCAVIALATRIGPGVATDPLGPRVFPLALGAAIVVCGLLLGAGALLLEDRAMTGGLPADPGLAEDADLGPFSPGRLAAAVAVTDRGPAPAQDGSGSAGDREGRPHEAGRPGCQVRRHGEAGGGAGPGRTPPASAEVALIVPLRRRHGPHTDVALRKATWNSRVQSDCAPNPPDALYAPPRRPRYVAELEGGGERSHEPSPG
jgi:hypothetical protein